MIDRIVPALIVAGLALAQAAAEPAASCCAPMKTPAAPAAGASCCCCAKMAAKNDSATHQPSLEELISAAKSAEPDKLLDSLAAVLNKLIEERKTPGGDTSSPPASQGHQH